MQAINERQKAQLPTEAKLLTQKFAASKNESELERRFWNNSGSPSSMSQRTGNSTMSTASTVASLNIKERSLPTYPM